MKVLESAPRRYDRGIRILTCGKLDRAYERLAAYIKRGQLVLDLGCGTGALTLMAARRGAHVKGIDVNPQMLEVGRERFQKEGLTEYVELAEMGVAELEAERSASYDVVTSGLCLSELSADELSYTLREVVRILRPGGLLLVADEARPRNILKRVLNGLLRFPLVVITYVITQTTTRSVEDLPGKLRDAGFIVERVRSSWMENFVELIARKSGRSGV
ncbi:MAG: methyltransferase domain-containing protein [candidate division Zixibacteria bacterium]|nr:methyltransferase domain-containing protein [candidate division Zixibacteria bacterium]